MSLSDHPELRAIERRQRARDIAKLVGAAVLGAALAVPVWPVLNWVCAAVWSVLLPW